MGFFISITRKLNKYNWSYHSIIVVYCIVSDKEGRCPAAIGFGICIDACDSDQECPGIQKCCSNGCGHVCYDPVEEGKWVFYIAFYYMRITHNVSIDKVG